jgi:lysophospholipase L1-like esterase
MKGWDWLTNGSYNWAFVARVVVKALVIFGLFNLLWIALAPMSVLGKVSMYGWLVPYRERLPYGEAAEANNLSTNSLEAMFATHAVNTPKASDEFRVIVIGDSATWGILLRPEETLVGQLNALNLQTEGKRMVFYNLGHPIMSVTKDQLLLSIAKDYQPDLVVFPLTLESLYRGEQLEPPIVQNNPQRVRDLIITYNLALDASELSNDMPRDFFGQRRLVADWWRLQGFGFAWATTRVDQVYGDYTPRTNDFEADTSWKDFAAEVDDSTLADALAFDVLQAAHTMMGDVPILLVNEPIYRADGTNSDLRYNLWYPRWAYDAYRRLLAQEATDNGWRIVDVWDAIAPERFTDSPVHLDAEGSSELAAVVAEEVKGQR